MLGLGVGVTVGLCVGVCVGSGVREKGGNRVWVWMW